MRFVRELEKKTDERGWLVELVRKDFFKGFDIAQVHVTTAHPGFVKGNHYHRRKKELFCVMLGKARLLLENVETGEKEEIGLDGDAPELVEILPLWAHAIKNTGSGDMYLLACVNEVFDQKDPDTYRFEVMK